MISWVMMIYLWSAPGHLQFRDVPDWGTCIIESISLMKQNPNVRAVQCVPGRSA